MPGKALATTSVPVIALVPKVDEAWKEGYVFSQDRWEGEDNKKYAFRVTGYFKKLGHTSHVFESSTKTWVKGKDLIIPYYKVWVAHPKDNQLYTWWTPTVANWSDPIDMSVATWFEFEEPKETK